MLERRDFVRKCAGMGFAGTLLLYVGWNAEFYNRTQFELTLTFATLFFAVFAAATLFMLRQEQGEGSIPLLFALANGVTYFFQAYAMINEISTTAMAWFSLALALIYLQLNRMRQECRWRCRAQFKDDASGAGHGADYGCYPYST